MSMVTFIDHPTWLLTLEIIARCILYTGIGFSLIIHFGLRGVEYVKNV
jgi:hypothetical protein